MANTIYHSAAREQFARFMVRENKMTIPQARYEFDEYLCKNGQFKTMEEYVKTRRTGAAMTLNRVARQSVYMSAQNAFNHVS